MNPFKPVGPSPNSFLPEDYVAEKAEKRANVLTLTLFAMVLAGVIGAFMYTNQRWRALQLREQIVNQQKQEEGQKMEQVKALDQQRAQMMEKAEITAALVERVPRWAMLAELTLRMPRDIRLDSFQLKSTRVDNAVKPLPPGQAPLPKPVVKSLTDTVVGKPKEPERPRVTAPKFEYNLTITGTAVHNNDIADYLASLKSSPILDKVEMSYIRIAKEGDRELRKFELTAALRQ